MLLRDKDNPTVNKLEARFAIVEKRIRALLDENGTLAARVGELERELAEAKSAARNLDEYQGKSTHIRRKIENVLQSLESIVPVKKD
jgi:cell division septum initiation protein DivIVA